MWIFGIVTASLYTFILFWGYKVSRERYFEHRVARSHDTFGREEFPDCADVASGVRALLEEWMGELALKTESDDLLRHHHILDDDIELSEFANDVEGRFDVSFDSIEADEVETLGDAIRFVERCRSRGAAGS